MKKKNPPARSVRDDMPEETFQPTLISSMLSGIYWLDDAVRQTLEAMGEQSWTRAQGFLLINVLFGERRANRLAKRLGVSRQAVGRLIRELVEMGVLTTEPDPDDARAVLVEVSQSSAAAGRATVGVVHAIEDYLAERLGADRLRFVREFMLLDWGVPPTLDATDVERAIERRKSLPGSAKRRDQTRELAHQIDTLPDHKGDRS